MSLSYDEYMELVPNETKTFVKNVLDCLDYYLSFPDYYAFTSCKIHSDTARKIIILCSVLEKNYLYKTSIRDLLSSTGISVINSINIKTTSSNQLPNYKEIFNNHSDLFQFYDEFTDHKYCELTPMNILNEVIEKNFIYELNEFFYKNTEYTKTKIKAFALTEKVIIQEKLKQEVFGNLPISVVNYLLESSKLYNTLLEKYDNKNEAIIISLLYGINECCDRQVESLRNILLENNYQTFLKKVQEKTMCFCSRNESISLIKKEYSKFFKEGVCTDKQENEVTVNDIFKNLLDRNVSRNIYVEKYLSLMGYTSQELIKKIDSQLNKPNGYYKRLELNKFYQNLPKDTINFIETATKIYQVIESRKESNSNYLITKEDLITLSLYISNHYYNGRISEFFKDNDVSYEKVLKLLNLNITKEEIDNVTFEQDILINNYKKFIFTNDSKDSSNITIEYVCSNLCNVEFCDSLILKNIFNKLSKDYNIVDNFNEQLEKHFDEKKIKEDNEIIEHFFKDLSNDTIEFLEDVSTLHKFIKKETDLLDKDLPVFSILFSILKHDETKYDEIKEFLNTKKIHTSSLAEYFNLDYFKDMDTDIKIIKNNYYDFIFNGFNKNKDRKDITIYSIFKNLFNEELNTSFEFRKFLSFCECSYDDFKNIDNEYSKHILKRNYNKLVRNNIDITFYNTALVIHNKIKELPKEDNNIMKSESDIEKISLLLSYLKLHDTCAKIKSFLIKHGLSINNIINYCNLKELENILEIDISKLEIDYELFFNNYEKYLGNIIFLIKNIILEDNDIIKNIVLNNNGNYRILKYEVENEKEYQPTLSEMIMELSNKQEENIDLNNINSILNFGNSLSHHSRYIHDEIPKLLTSESSEKSINTINSLIDKSYVNTTQKKKSFFERLFGIDEVNPNETKINLKVIGELKDSIDSNISALSEELILYDSIRKYIEVYQTKSKTYLQVIRNSVDFLNKSLKEVNPDNDEEYFDYLNITSHLQIMREKEKRFVTSSLLMRQELLKISQIIVNHFITINSLEMARDDLIPLVGAELVIGLGRESENQSLDLSQSVMELFRAILTRNIDGTEENLKKLKEVGISNDTFNLINRDISSYINSLEENNSFNNLMEEDLKIKKLTLK